MLTKKATELESGDTILLYGFEYEIRRTEIFYSGKVGVWLVKPDVFDSVLPETKYTIVPKGLK